MLPSGSDFRECAPRGGNHSLPNNLQIDPFKCEKMPNKVGRFFNKLPSVINRVNKPLEWLNHPQHVCTKVNNHSPPNEGVLTEPSEHQRLMSGSRAPERLEPHLAMETSISSSRSTSSGSHLVRDQVEDLGKMPRSRDSW
jgi:hypothetical protein